MLTGILATTMAVAAYLGFSTASRLTPVLGAPFFLQQAASPQDNSTTKPTTRKKAEEGSRTEGDRSAHDQPADDMSAETPEGFVWKPRPSLRFGNVRVDFEARLQGDFHRSYDGADISAGLRTFELRRSRVGVEGNLFKHIEFEVERDLTEKDLTAAELAEGLTPKSPWKDVNVNVDYFKAAQVRAGRFKIPFGLDELTGLAHHDFAYRSLGADYLAPARDIGVMVHGRFYNRGLSYWVGGFRHDGDNARSKSIQGGNRTFAVRVTGRPFRRLASTPLDRLEVGAALTRSALSDDSFRPNGLRTRTVMTEDTFFSAVYVNGRRRRWEGDLDWPVGRASMRAEYSYVTDDRLGQGYSSQDLPDARYRSWYISGTYLITGENKTRPLKPHRAFLQGGAGAIEVAARYERLWCDSVGGQDVPFRNPRAEHILPSGDRVLTLGVNWVVNRWVTLTVNGIREHIQDPERSPVPNGGGFWSRVLRFQLVL